jgi:anti-sigma28 factor (negative regulator of flagellin synthesis)
MFLPHLPIDIMRIVSLNRSRKFRRMFDSTVRRKRTPRFGATPTMSSTEQIRLIRRRAAGVEAPPTASFDLRMEHIARIRTAIAEGRYYVSAEELTQKLVDTLLEIQPRKS